MVKIAQLRELCHLFDIAQLALFTIVPTKKEATSVGNSLFTEKMLFIFIVTIYHSTLETPKKGKIVNTTARKTLWTL